MTTARTRPSRCVAASARPASASRRTRRPRTSSPPSRAPRTGSAGCAIAHWRTYTNALRKAAVARKAKEPTEATEPGRARAGRRARGASARAHPRRLAGRRRRAHRVRGSTTGPAPEGTGRAGGRRRVARRRTTRRPRARVRGLRRASRAVAADHGGATPPAWPGAERRRADRHPAWCRSGWSRSHSRCPWPDRRSRASHPHPGRRRLPGRRMTRRGWAS